MSLLTAITDNNRQVTQMTYFSKRGPGWRPALLGASLVPLVLALTGCLGGSGGGGSSHDGGGATLTGTFVDSAVSGLDYVGTATAAALTDEQGQFEYQTDETLTFSIGDLTLGSASGAEVITPLSLVAGAQSAEDQRVTNMLILLQTLDADGDLNNGIQITEAIREEVSFSANQILFDQPVEAFRASLQPLLATLQEQEAFSDADPRPRTVTRADSAREHFQRSTSARVEVETTGGRLRGFAANDHTWQFFGVPYAKPPLGDLRWRPPVKAEPWSGVREAVGWADQSAQDPTLQGVNKGGMSEDSLYLNITAPKNAEKLPVMVWFHGGSFAILSANSMQYNNPDSLTRKGVVLVTVNHRLGPFGYIAHPLLTQESGYNGSGNYGQMDLVMALEWVRDNIGAFGGDPGNVTLFGQSGGGGKTYSLMNSPQAKGLFHKAIVQSGAAPLDTVSAPGDSLAVSERIGSALFERAGVATLEEARALPWTAFAQADLENRIPRETYRPNADNFYQPDTYYHNAINGMPSDVPLMAGATNGDYSTLRAALPIWLTQRSDTYQSNQYVYKFSRVPDGWADMGLRSCHGCELPYLFNHPKGMVQNFLLGLVLTPQGTRPVIGDINGNGTTGSQGDEADVLASMEYGADDDSVAELMMTLWTNFAKTGDPSTETLEWPPYTNANDTFVEIGPHTDATVETGLAPALQ